MAPPTDPELKDGFPIPGWMRNRATRDFEPFASPPSADDSFFFIKYPKPDQFFSAKDSASSDVAKVISATGYNPKEKDWSKHTKPCQDVIHGITPITATANAALNKKSSGTDDGFKESDACGSSIVKVANQMISSSRGFTVATPSEEPDKPSRQQLMTRRGSRSLPATPGNTPPQSPNSRRKKVGNRYFTSPFEPTADASNRSWLTMALLGLKKDLAGSTSTLAEEDSQELRLHGLAESVENLGPAPKIKEPLHISRDTTQQPKLTKPAGAFRPKPTELREMNFWSPTSM